MPQKNKIKKVAFSSSATVYGEPDIFPTPERIIFQIKLLFMELVS